MASLLEFFVSFLTESKAELIEAHRAAPPRFTAALPAARAAGSPQHHCYKISLISLFTRVLSAFICNRRLNSAPGRRQKTILQNKSHDIYIACYENNVYFRTEKIIMYKH